MTQTPALIEASALAPWTDEILSLCRESTALVIGLFDAQGEVRACNHGFKALLGGEAPARPRHTFLVNPTFEALSAREGQGLVFSGWLTVGDGSQLIHTIRSRLYRRGAELLLVGDFDVVELDRLGRELVRTNREINSLQSELIHQNTRLTQTVDELRTTQSMLVHAEKMNALGQLVAGVAHEVNGPLSFVSANLSSLRDAVDALLRAYASLEGLVPPQAATAVRAANDLDFVLGDLPALLAATVDGVNRAVRVVAQLRSFSRHDEAERKVVDLTSDLRATVEIARSELHARAIEVRWEIEGTLTVECYPAELNQVFMNLVVNAAQAMPNGGSLTIGGTTEPSGEVRLWFGDTGHGIPPEVLPRIFDPFFTTKPVGSGTGLGLSISYGIVVKRHGGRIDATSPPGAGATFTLWLPPRLPAPMNLL